MNTKKFDESVYVPDKKGQKEKVVIGLSGGLHSFVTAYLLKIQKYELIGVTILGSPDGALGNDFNCQITQDDLSRIQEFCKGLGINHLVIPAQEAFTDEVIGLWTARKLSGKFSSPCWHCHHFRMDQLFKKALELDASFVATGHFAKVFKHESHQGFYVHTGNDEEHDSSGLLSRLPHDSLAKLMLPLSDLQTKEVLKLAENFGIKNKESIISKFQCLMDPVKTKEYLQGHCPKRYLGKGEVFNSLEAKTTDHEGVYQFNYGQILGQKENSKTSEEYLAKYSMRERTITTMPQEYFVKKHFMLDHSVLAEETSKLIPMQGIAKLPNGDYLECWFELKILNHAFVELDRATFLPEGAMITIQRKKGKNAKVLITGRVVYLTEERSKEENDEKNKINYGFDF